MDAPFSGQLVNVLAAFLLLLAFAMLSQRRILTLIHLFAWQGAALVAFALAAPISQMAGTITRATLGIALASVLLSFLMMIVRRKAVPQVIGFLAMENGLFFAATSATYGMPLVVELGVALDVLVGTFIFGIFFFHIREQFDSLDIRHMEKLKQD